MILSSISLGSLTGPKLATFGLGSLASLSALTAQQTYALARQAGFDETHARQMVAIAQRESSLRPEVIGTISPTERSYGLWQINVKDPAVWARVKAATGITSPDQLSDPLTNAKAAYALWNGNDNNLNIAWYINRNTESIPYKDRYENFLNQLPSTNVLESSYTGSTVGSTPVYAGANYPPSGEGDDGYVDGWFSPSGDEAVSTAGFNLDLSSTTVQIGLAAGLFLVLYLNSDRHGR